VLVPVISTGVKEARKLPGFGVYAREVRPFVTITTVASEGKIGIVITPVMLPRNNVLDVKCHGIVALMDTAIFAAVIRSVAYV
jgi:hypothetical protein